MTLALLLLWPAFDLLESSNSQCLSRNNVALNGLEMMRNNMRAVWCTDWWACKHKGKHRKAHASISNHHGHACEHVLTRGHTRARVHSFTLCLCGLGEPAKLSFLLLSEVSQSDPLALSTCSSHSQTAEAAVSQHKAEGERKRGGKYGKRKLQYELQYKHSYCTQESFQNKNPLLNPSLDYVFHA